MIVMTSPKSVRLKYWDYDVTPYIIAHFYPKSVMGRRRFATCSVDMGDCRRRVRGVL